MAQPTHNTYWPPRGKNDPLYKGVNKVTGIKESAQKRRLNKAYIRADAEELKARKEGNLGGAHTLKELALDREFVRSKRAVDRLKAKQSAPKSVDDYKAKAAAKMESTLTPCKK
jgi:hypothetical protein